MNRFEMILALLATVLVFASAMLDPLLTISLVILLVLLFVIERQLRRDDRWQSRS
ncbi:MAG: hypothetical protein K8L99_00105 [Anaerolineae bacterium]|nr:hypothetical protein [Anaerolineae bacterium]